MKQKGRILAFCILFIHTLAAKAATDLHFEHIDTRGHMVYCICRDADGVVWAGTSNGLTTLAQLQSSRPFSYVRHKALNEIIHNIRQDNMGRLWLTTNTEHLIVYDARRNHTITNIAAYFKTIGLENCDEQLTTIDAQGRLWTSNGKAIFCYNFKTKEIRKFTFPQINGVKPNGWNILSLQSNNEEIIVATSTDIFYISDSTQRLVHNAQTPQTFTTQFITMVRDWERNLWIAADNKLFRFDAAAKKWDMLNSVHHVKDIVATQTGQVYVATSNYGLYIFDKSSPSALQAPVNLKQAPPNTDGLLNNHIERLYYDQPRQAIVVTYNKSNLSIGTLQSEKYAIHRLATAANQYQPEDIISFTATADGRSFWAGSEDGGMFRIESSGNYPIVENRFRGHTVSALFTDSNNHLWTGLYNEGLFAADGRVYCEGSSPYAIVQPIRGGKLFVALLGQGIVAIDPQTGKTETVKTNSPWVLDLTECNGRVYAVTNNFIHEINAATLATKLISTDKFGKDAKIKEGHRELMTDKRGWLWVVSNVNHSPLYIYETKTGKTHALDEMEKYIVHSICADKFDNIWCTTDEGLVRISTNGQQFTYSRYQFNVRHDFNYNKRALYALPNGNLVAGTDRGFISFNPKLLTADNRPQSNNVPPIITLLRINSQLQAPPQTDSDKQKGCGNGIEGDIIYTRELNLSHKENNIVIECRPRGFMPEMAYQYYYMLKGHSDQWTPTNNNNIIFSNLPPGQYDLYLRMAPTADDTSEEFHMMHINIRQSFWRSPWGYALYAAVLGAMAIAVFLIVRNRQRYRREIREIEQQKQQEEKLNEMKNRFFTNVSHDLRTPLSLILAPAEELIQRFSAQPQTDNTLFMLSTIKRNASRLLQLVNQILDVRRMEIAGDTLHIEQTDINKMLSDIATAYVPMTLQRDIALNISLPEQPLIMGIDKEKITKVINNLVSNAFKFTPDGGNIDIICKTMLNGKGDNLVVQVADTGYGISKEDLPHIFERYYYSKQLHTSHESSGIGLSIVKQYTELMDGSVSVENNTPRGTRFTITIPINKTSQNADKTEMPTEELPAIEKEKVEPTVEEPAAGKQTIEKETVEKPANEIRKEKPTVLLADDNADLLNFLVTSLANDYKTLAASSGEEALRLLNDEENIIDVVVSDIMMPGTDGLELTRRIKQDVNLSHIPVILLTAKALEEDQLRGLQMGANDYITKPFNIEILRLRINSWMQRRKAAREKFNNQPVVEPEKLTITTLDEQLLQQAVSLVSEHMHEPDFNVDQLASLIGIHRTGLNRKLQFITGQTPILFIRTLRMKRACQIMEADPSLPVSQVAYQVGFNNPKLFAKHFMDEYGMRPSEFIKKKRS
ncbi:MAG: response regulator [Prevotella sp.]|nr:response regulator [Prevotella sp.]